MKRLTYKSTIFASYIGYVVQSLVNFAPLLYVRFQTTYNISLSQLATLTLICFCSQIVIDFLASRYVDKIGYRTCAIAANIFSATGLFCLSFLPDLLSPFIGLIISILIYAIGCGLIEVIVSPIVEACPTKNKEKSMGLLHSIYSWGSVIIIGFSTLFFHFFGMENWKILARLWSIIPTLNAIFFCIVPIYTLSTNKNNNTESIETNELSNTSNIINNTQIKKHSTCLFWLFILLMVCAGATENAISQWASAFAEEGLNITKTLGDVMGPMLFAFLMGVSRVFYAKKVKKDSLSKFLLIGSIGCFFSYLLIFIFHTPLISLIGCALCGLFVGILWPGTYSYASIVLPQRKTSTFALLALGGDIGCSLGPAIIGFFSDLLGNMKYSFAIASIFPILAIIGILRIQKKANLFKINQL